MKPIAYTRRQMAEMLGISEQRVRHSKKVVEIGVWSSRSRKFVIRYLLKSELTELIAEEKTTITLSNN